MINHVVVHEANRSLADRQTISVLTGRSVHTIRLRCPVAGYRYGKALYDVDQCETILKDLPVRRRRTDEKAA